MSPAGVFQFAHRFIHKNGKEKAWECRACGAKLSEEAAQATNWDCPACGASMEPVQKPITNLRALMEE